MATDDCPDRYTQKTTRCVPELLAPAGRLDVFRAVLAAGADAVYVAGKRFNMRRHRKDYNFSPEDLQTAVQEAHAAGSKLYVTVNSLVGQGEIPRLRGFLRDLADIGVDAVIVQDLAVVRICHEEGLSLPLHASTMMNVSSAETARTLKGWGFSRLVTSRDITIDMVRRIRERAGIEVEYFLHGDMCSVLSGQCLASGLMFGKSANRGQCMKPCRWAYDLVSESTDRVVKEGAFLLASKDMCLLQHLPALIDAGVDALKIEGRMRPAETLVPIVEAYRRAIDQILSEPMASGKNFAATQAQQQSRTRDLTTGFAFKHPDDSFMDTSGEREPIIFSTHGRMPTCKTLVSGKRQDVGHGLFAGEKQGDAPVPELTVVVGNVDNARAALAAGCDWLILSWEGNLTVESGWTLAELDEIAEQASATSTPVLLTTPRVLDERSARELRQVVAANQSLSGYVIAAPGALEVVRKGGQDATIGSCGSVAGHGFPRKSNLVTWADAAMNVLNAEAAEWLHEHGITRIMPAPEASLESIRHMMQAAPDCRFDLLAHGPLTGMLIDHCLIAMNTQQGSKADVCRMPCAVDRFSMVDKKGTSRRIFVDRYCRNHVLMEHDLAMLPELAPLLAPGPASIRMDGRLYDPETLARLMQFYHRWLHEPENRAQIETDFDTQFPASEHTFGGYPLGICRDDEISRLELRKKEKNEG